MDQEPKTGINEQWAQSELTKSEKKPINIPQVPEDARLPQINDEGENLEFQKSQEELWGVTVPHDQPNVIVITQAGREVGKLIVTDGKLSFEGDLNKSALTLFELFKLYAEKFLADK